MIPETHMIRPVWAEINLDRLAYNIREARRVTPSSSMIMAAVKADGYGHGAVEASKVFLVNGADRLATATLGEAVHLRRHGIEAPILVLGYVPEYLYPLLLQHDVSATVYCLDHAEALSISAVKAGLETVVHVKVDTGMGRLGFGVDEAADAVIAIDSLPGITVEGVFTHFAISDETDKTYTRAQYSKYMRVIKELDDRGFDVPVKHVSNSAAVIDMPSTAWIWCAPASCYMAFTPRPT